MFDLRKMDKKKFYTFLFTGGILLAFFALYLACILRKALSDPLNVIYNPIKMMLDIIKNGLPSTLFFIFLALFEIPYFAYVPRLAKTIGEADKLGRDFFTSDENQVYGDTHFEDPAEYADVALVQPQEEAYGTIFGQLDKEGKQLINFRPGPNRINSHILTVGASGSGKTYTFTKPYAYQALKRRESIIFTDPDGGLTRDLANLFRENGYIVRVFDLKSPRKSDGWNCMECITKGDNMELNAQLFADAIISNIPGSTNTQPIYHDGPLALLKALLLRVATDEQGIFREKTIREVYNILQNSGGESYLNETIFNPDLLTDNEKICLGPYNSFRLASDNLRGNLITNLATSLNLLQAGPIADVLSTEGIDLTLPGRQPCAYFCKFPDSHDTYRFIVSLFFSNLFTQLTDYADNQIFGPLPIPVNFMLDEFPSIGVIPDFDRKISTIRKRNMNVAMIIQDITQLQNNYPTTWTTLISNCATFFSLGINDEYTANMVTKRIGETTVEVSTQQHEAIESIFKIYNKHSSGKGKRSLLSYEELFKLDKDDCVILFEYHNPIHAHKYPHVLHDFSQNIPPYYITERSDLTDVSARQREYDEEKERVDMYLKEHPLDQVDRSYSWIFEKKEDSKKEKKIKEKKKNIKEMGTKNKKGRNDEERIEEKDAILQPTSLSPEGKKALNEEKDNEFYENQEALSQDNGYLDYSEEPAPEDMLFPDAPPSSSPISVPVPPLPPKSPPVSGGYQVMPKPDSSSNTEKNDELHCNIDHTAYSNARKSQKNQINTETNFNPNSKKTIGNMPPVSKKKSGQREE